MKVDGSPIAGRHPWPVRVEDPQDADIKVTIPVVAIVAASANRFDSS
jgi:hypothetical protein